MSFLSSRGAKSLVPDWDAPEGHQMCFGPGTTREAVKTTQNVQFGVGGGNPRALEEPAQGWKHLQAASPCTWSCLLEQPQSLSTALPFIAPSFLKCPGNAGVAPKLC